MVEARGSDASRSASSAAVMDFGLARVGATVQLIDERDKLRILASRAWERPHHLSFLAETTDFGLASVGATLICWASQCGKRSISGMCRFQVLARPNRTIPTNARSKAASAKGLSGRPGTPTKGGTWPLATFAEKLKTYAGMEWLVFPVPASWSLGPED